MLTAAVGRRHGDQPRQRAGPGAGPADALHEAGAVEQPDALRVAEDNACHGD